MLVCAKRHAGRTHARRVEICIRLIRIFPDQRPKPPPPLPPPRPLLVLFVFKVSVTSLDAPLAVRSVRRLVVGCEFVLEASTPNIPRRMAATLSGSAWSSV